MGFGAFLRDRLVYMAAYSGFGLLTLLVVQLDLWLSGASLQFVNLIYVLVLGLVGLLLYLWWEYQRQAPFMRYLEGISGHEPLEQLAVLPEAPNLEGGLFVQAWGRLYSRLTGELIAERERGQRNIGLISQWAHHMKTPVSVIDLVLQKARAEELPPGLDATLTSLAEENERLKHSLQMLLNMVRLEDFAGDFRVERVDLTALVRQMINERKREFIVRRVYPKVAVAADPDTPRALYVVESDAKWLRFVLEQIVSNAIKYASPGEGESEAQGWVEFRLYREGGDVVLEVADNGIGIAPEDLGRVFDPFFTGLNGRAFPQATGMGLYLAREVCQRLGHRLHLESVKGEGTRVFLRIAASQTIFSGLREMVAAKVTRL